MDALTIIRNVFGNFESQLYLIATVALGIGAVKLLLSLGWDLYHSFLYRTGRGRGSD